MVSRCMCGCNRKEIDMEYKVATLTWKINQGEYVNKGSAICDAEVEKSVIEVFWAAEGRLVEICVQNGEMSGTKCPIGYIESKVSADNFGHSLCT